MYKLVVLGSCGVGKSALTVRFLQNRFVAEYEPTVRNVYRGQLLVECELCQLASADTSGAEELQQVRDTCIRWGQGFLLVYAVDYIKTFVDVNCFWEQLRRLKGRWWVPMVLVANKVELAHWLVDSDLGREAAASFRAPFVEMSAKTRQGMQAFRELVREMRGPVCRGSSAPWPSSLRTCPSRAGAGRLGSALHPPVSGPPRASP